MTDAQKLGRKSVKRIKKFFQEDGSLKARADSLIEYLDDADDGGRLLFLQENHQTVLVLIRDYFGHKFSKLKGTLPINDR